MSKILRYSMAVAVILMAPAVLGFTPVPAGPVSGTWPAAGSPYLVQGDIAIPDGSQLTIASGVEVVFEGLYTLDVLGSLLAVGAAQDSIVFTATDTEVGWQGISFESGAEPSVIDFGVIEHGRGTTAGGGITCRTANLTLTRSRISHNRAAWGGGINVSVSEGTPTISECIISDNECEDAGGGICWAGMNIVLTNCRVENNTMHGNSDSSPGGAGIYCWGFFVGSTEITGCTVRNNRIFGLGRGAGIYMDGAMHEGATISHCDIEHNIAESFGGGGLYIGNTQDCNINNCRFSFNYGPFHMISWNGSGSAISLGSGNNTVTHCTFDHNFCGSSGTVFCRSNTSLTMDSCTFSHNMDNCADGGGALRLEGDAAITNTIVGNQQSNFGGNPSAAINFISGTHSVRHCDLFGSFGGIDVTGPAMPEGLGTITGTNANGHPCDDCANIYLDGLFCDAPEGDLQIAENSPCLGAGEDGVTIGAHGVGCQAIGVPWPPTPEVANLVQNYPNPFNPTTTIEYRLSRAGAVRLEVYDLQGRLVRQLRGGEQEPAGRHEATWDGRDLCGREMAAGTYLYRLEVGTTRQSRSMVLVR